ANVPPAWPAVAAFVHGTSQILTNFGLTRNFPNIRKTRNGAKPLLYAVYSNFAGPNLTLYSTLSRINLFTL
ncbi:hypothetical protein SAMN05444363_0048, partial [Flavobacterium terrae]